MHVQSCCSYNAIFAVLGVWLAQLECPSFQNGKSISFLLTGYCLRQELTWGCEKRNIFKAIPEIGNHETLSSQVLLKIYLFIGMANLFTYPYPCPRQETVFRIRSLNHWSFSSDLLFFFLNELL